MSDILNLVNQTFQKIGEYFVAPMFLGFLTYIIIKVKSWIEKHSYHYKFKRSEEKNNKVNNLLTELRIKLSARRSYLFVFHNGKTTLDGSEIFFKTRTNESTSFGVAPTSDQFISIPVSLIQDEIALVKQPGPSFTLVSDLTDGRFKRLCQSAGVFSLARCPIRKGELLLGGIGIDWGPEVKCPPDNIEEAVFYSGLIENVLSSE